MAYATYSDVNQYLSQWGFQIGALTVPNITTVTTWITRFEALINSYLKRCGYDVPATGANDIALLADISSQAIAVRVWTVIYQGRELEGTVADWKANVEAMVADIKSCNFVLLDQLEDSDEDSGTSIGVTMLRVFEDEEDDYA
jgi:hypothetical protein